MVDNQVCEEDDRRPENTLYINVHAWLYYVCVVVMCALRGLWFGSLGKGEFHQQHTTRQVGLKYRVWSSRRMFTLKCDTFPKFQMEMCVDHRQLHCVM